MMDQPLQKRCEICLNFDPDDKKRRVLKSLTARNPGKQAYYEQVAVMFGDDAGDSSDMGTCYLTKERVQEIDVCSEFLSDITRHP